MVTFSEEAEYEALFGVSSTANLSSDVLFEQLTADNPARRIDVKFHADFLALKPETQRIIVAICHVTKGSTRSYKDIGSDAGLINAARQVARVLHGLSGKYQLPWWRIIRADGQIALHEPERSEQIQRLEAEGVAFSEQGKIIKNKNSNLS